MTLDYLITLYLTVALGFIFARLLYVISFGDDDDDWPSGHA